MTPASNPEPAMGRGVFILKPPATPTSQKSLHGIHKLKTKYGVDTSSEPRSSSSSITTPLNASPSPGSPTMAARSRPRNAGPKDDQTHEEQAMWDQIKADIAKCGVIKAKANEVSKKIIEKEESMARQLQPSIKDIDELAALHREGVKLAEEEQKLLYEEPADLIKNVEILKALRTATESEPTRQQAAQAQALATSTSSQGASSGGTANSKSRKPKTAPKLDMLDGAADSPGLSPGIGSASATGNPMTGRLKASGGRSGSVSSIRKDSENASSGKADKEKDKEVMTSVKKEEESKDKDSSVATAAPSSSMEGTKGPSAERAGKFFVGAEVAYKQTKMREDGSQWIQCNIISITEVGKDGKKRYEVQDPEPDEGGAPGQIYRTGAAALIAIPKEEERGRLLDFAVGKQVLARYPETTTFYRAEVTGRGSGKKGDEGRAVCRLKFEDDQNQEMEVDRRFVLELGGSGR